MMHTYFPGTGEVKEARGSVLGQPLLDREFETSLGYMLPFQKKERKVKERNNERSPTNLIKQI